MATAARGLSCSPGSNGPRTQNPRISLLIHTPNGEKHEIVLGRAATLQHLREAIKGVCGPEGGDPQLFCAGKLLSKNEASLHELGLTEGTEIFTTLSSSSETLQSRCIWTRRIIDPALDRHSAWPLQQENVSLHFNWGRCAHVIQDGSISEPLPQPRPVFARCTSSPSSIEREALRNRVEAVRERLEMSNGARRSRRKLALRRQLASLTPPPSLPSSIPSSVSSQLSDASSLGLSFMPSPETTPQKGSRSRCIMCPTRVPLAAHTKCICGTWLCANHNNDHSCPAPKRPSAASLSAKNLFA